MYMAHGRIARVIAVLSVLLLLPSTSIFSYVLMRQIGIKATTTPASPVQTAL
jgi:hypothetical protein